MLKWSSVKEDIIKIDSAKSTIRQLHADMAKAKFATTSGRASEQEKLEQRLRDNRLSMYRLHLDTINPMIQGKSRLQILQEELASSQANLHQSRQRLESIKQHLHSCREEQARLSEPPLE